MNIAIQKFKQFTQSFAFFNVEHYWNEVEMRQAGNSLQVPCTRHASFDKTQSVVDSKGRGTMEPDVRSVIWMFPKIWENPPNHPILIGFGTLIFTIHFGCFPTIFGNTHMPVFWEFWPTPGSVVRLLAWDQLSFMEVWCVLQVVSEAHHRSHDGNQWFWSWIS